MKICHASIDENGHIKGGIAGDQTGKEVCERSWWDKGWNVVLRHPNENISNQAANVASLIAKSNLCGYDQNQRNTLHTSLKQNGYDIKKFLSDGIKVEADCSSFVTCCYLCAGVKTLEYNSNAPTTSTMENVFKNAGFKVLKDEKYLRKPDLLKKGDILVKAGSHTVIVIESGEGEKVKDYYPPYRGKATTLSQALSEMGIDSSKAHRKEIYSVNYTDKYNYTAYQNNQMLGKLKLGSLVKP